ncbi:hypothetical protein HUJ05_011416 [Dendroctonus ponderosae]|nr:hypothetical protein HUJ05_011416 [Dendroctonus ponderosae]
MPCQMEKLIRVFPVMLRSIAEKLPEKSFSTAWKPENSPVSSLQSNHTNQSGHRVVQKNTSSKPQVNLDYFLANDGLDPNYPLSEIQRFFQKHPEHKLFFKPSLPQIGNRGGWTNEDSENLCKVRRNPAYAPQVLANIQGAKKTIINQDDLKQHIPTERCINSNQSDYRCSNIRLGYRSICKQNFMSVKLATFNSTVGIAYDTFKVPSCCSCVLVEAP